jgi:hypothetical protein
MEELYIINKKGLVCRPDGQILPSIAIKKLINASLSTLEALARQDILPAVPVEKEKIKPLEERQNDFYTSLKDFQAANFSLYPAPMYERFCEYWTESGGKKMRCETSKIFELKGRLRTWWHNTKAEDKQKLWAEHNKRYPNGDPNFQKLL